MRKTDVSSDTGSIIVQMFTNKKLGWGGKGRGSGKHKVGKERRDARN